MSLTPRDYQIRAVDKTRAEIKAGKRAVLLVSPTGSGKTFVACMIIRLAVARGSRVLFLAHREELIKQCSNKLNEFDVSHGIIKAGYDPSHRRNVQIASVQTFRARHENLAQGYDLIIHDEAHRAVSEEHMIPRRLNPQAIALGLTATPCRMDGRGLKDAFDAMVEVATVQELVDHGHLCPIRTFEGPVIKALSKVHKQAGDYKQDELAEIMNTRGMIGDIVKEWSRLAYGRPTVVFGASVAHSKALCEAFNQVGAATVHIDGTMNREDRAAAFEAFNTQKAMVLCNYGICTEGWDAPFCSCGIGARPTLSLSLYLQMVGRIMRTAPNKREALWLDFGNLRRNHGYVTDPHEWTLDGLNVEAEERQTTRYKCKACGVELRSKPRFCPGCGIDTQAGQGELFGSATNKTGYTLIEVSPATKPSKPAQAGNTLEIRFLAELKKAHEKGYKPGWAIHRHKVRTGRYPNKALLEKSKHKTTEITDPATGKRSLVWV